MRHKLKVGECYYAVPGEIVLVLNTKVFTFCGDPCINTKIMREGKNTHKARRVGREIGTSIKLLKKDNKLPKILSELIK